MGRPRKVEITDVMITARALDYAKECHMKPEIAVSVPVKTDYGWEVTLQNDKGVCASLRFTKDGMPSYWEVTSR